MRLAKYVPLGLVCWVGLVTGCGVGPEAPAVEVAASLEFDPTQPRSLRGAVQYPVTGLAEVSDGAFAVQGRQGDLRQFPCGACHQQALVPAPRGVVSRRWAHMDIQPVHPQAHISACQTCHDYGNLERLRLQDDTSTDFDQVYRLCVQCHFQQGRDWAGGAHGKRVGGWRGARVVMNCTDCHDPHQPAFGRQYPVSGPRVPRTPR
ncbi:MAG: hypothetical protein GKR89_08450 [Candidatus Latescibacteria bacterium]|nr:hypothetical protein [Candidatus Latescibacterota bacterium]